eukprot:s162_g40.t1
MALQQGAPFARHYILSTAASADCDFGSGEFPCDNWKPQSLGSSLLLCSQISSLSAGSERFGEARHPGPDRGNLLTVGVSNPCGLRQKEDILLSLGPGIWSLAETHLSQQTFRTCSSNLRKGARALNREIRFYGGSPAPLRQGSSWAGKWTGVAVLSDVPATKLDVPWPLEHWNSGRVLLTRHWAASTPITVGTVYGYPKGPTWPRAKQLSDQILETFTTELVLGMSGVRMIMGDYNHEPGQLTQHQIWMRHGWRSAQQLAAELFDHEVQPTCKGTTETDQIWLSPEAICLVRGLQVRDHFMDHSTISVDLLIPAKPIVVNRWPQPSLIPWHQLDLTDWDPPCNVPFTPEQDPTTFVSNWAKDFEQAVNAQVRCTSGSALSLKCHGRAQRLRPVRSPQAANTCRPSREGEVRVENALIGTATRIWFKQLRRLQSLRHAVSAGKQTTSACIYRMELWTAIRHSSGFHPDFPTWWSQQTHSVEGVLQELPLMVPTDSVIVMALYESFLGHFRAFEAWHLGQRTACLKMKYEGTLEAIYKDLRDEPRSGIDHLWTERPYTILDVDQESGQVHLDQPLHDKFDSVWTHLGHTVDVVQGSGDICTVSDPERLSPGDELVQRIFVTDTNDILSALEAHWQPRWSALADIPSDQWRRIMDFTQRYMPRHTFSWPVLTMDMWQRSAKRFKTHAARGPDGFHKDDLVHMPASHQSQLLSLLHSIEHVEHDATPWPAQFSFGNVVGLAKIDGAHEEGHFRPITVLSTQYRNWARLRTRQLLHQMSQFMPPEVLGFMPHRETTEVWFHLQATIELMIQQGHPYSGLSTDLRRAFNNIGRKQIFMVAAHLGLPWPLLNAWQKFLRVFVRRFDVHGAIGNVMVSTSGFPEGCPLSIISMLVVNWSYHVYMRVFCPRVSTFSFVDNLTLAANEARSVIQAYFALRTVCQLFGLFTDDDKTYVWALTKHEKDVLAQLQFPCLSDSSELGGAMTFGAARRNRVLRARGDKLTPKWTRLRRSFAPQLQKFSMLPKVFWPQALHGASNCMISDNYALELRRAAVKALHISGAGSNPLLRLSLADDMTNDPGFFQLRLCVQTLRRMLRKTPDLQIMWKLWQHGYTGKQTPGPFTRLLHCLSGIGWAILDPPMVVDHEGHVWNLLTMDSKTLRTLLQDGWLQYVASQTRHRTMRDLSGLDGRLTLMDAASMLPLDRARLSALHSGAFISNFEKSKFDEEKTPFCTMCNQEDDRAHWLCCPRYAHLRATIPGWHADNVELPDCMINHLLVPRLSQLVQWRAMLYAIEDGTQNFCVLPPKTGFHHLFVDGSCTVETYPELQLASWGVINATMGLVVSSAPLHGITQTIDRAELAALVSAVQWGGHTELELCIWSDSLSTVTTAERLSALDFVPECIENYDLWQLFLSALHDRQGITTDFRWIPSHLTAAEAEDCFEDWAICWNGLVDRLVVQQNGARPEDTLNHLRRLRALMDSTVTRLRQLRQFFFAVADQGLQNPRLAEDCIEVCSSADDDEWFWIPCEEHLPLNWQIRCMHGNFSVPGRFLVDIIHWICAAERRVSDASTRAPPPDDVLEVTPDEADAN